MTSCLLNQFFQDESGQDLVEYSLLLALLALAALAVLSSAGNSIVSLWNGISNALTSATTSVS